jgi:hypothetical protein
MGVPKPAAPTPILVAIGSNGRNGEDAGASHFEWLSTGRVVRANRKICAENLLNNTWFTASPGRV